MARELFDLFLFIGLSLGLIGCGQRLCVGGIGDCAITSKPAGQTTTQAGTNRQFNLNVFRSTLYENEAVLIEVENSSADWRIDVIDGLNALKLEKSGPYSVIYTASTLPAGVSSQFTMLRGKDNTRFTSEKETPLAFADIVIQTKKR